MATATHARLQESGSGMTRRNVIRWVGRVAVAGALTTLGASDFSGTVDAKRQGMRRNTQRRHDQPLAVSAKAIDATFLQRTRSTVTWTSLATDDADEWCAIPTAGARTEPSANSGLRSTARP